MLLRFVQMLEIGIAAVEAADWHPENARDPLRFCSLLIFLKVVGLRGVVPPVGSSPFLNINYVIKNTTTEFQVCWTFTVEPSLIEPRFAHGQVRGGLFN